MALPQIRRREGNGPTVGQTLLQRFDSLLQILSGEPKHSTLDQAYLAAKEALERVTGVPARHAGRYTGDGEALVVPTQRASGMDEQWVRDPLVAVPVSRIDKDGNVMPEPVVEANTDASGQSSAAGGNGNSGASSGQAPPTK